MVDPISGGAGFVGGLDATTFPIVSTPVAASFVPFNAIMGQRNQGKA